MHLEIPYKKEFFDQIKSVVPNKERSWNRSRDQYWISDLYLDEVDNLIFDYFGKYGEGRE